MPVSSSVQISDCLAHIVGFQPQSVLDVGCGFGLWGFLCREYLDVWNGRVQPHEWQVRIDGLELWEPYIQAHQRALYTNIFVRDIREALPDLESYDLIIAGDVIEHLDKEDAELVLDTLYEKARLALLVNIPLTGHWDHPIQYGNPGELHRSQWVPEDFAGYPNHFKEYKLPCGEYGSFVCPKACHPADRAVGLLQQAARRDAGGNAAGAARARAQVQVMVAEDAVAAIAVTDTLLQAGDLQGALKTLRTVIAAQPDYHYARLALVRILLAQKQPDEGARELQALLALEDLPEDIQAQAQQLAREVSR